MKSSPPAMLATTGAENTAVARGYRRMTARGGVEVEATVADAGTH